MKRFVYGLFLVVLTSVACAWQWPADNHPAPTRDLDAQPDLGIDASLHGLRAFPADDLWNKDISKEKVDPHSDTIIKEIGADKPLHGDFGARNGIPYVVVGKGMKMVDVKFTDYPDESDKGPYPIPDVAPIEGGGQKGGDCHVLVIDRDSGLLYELWHAAHDGKGWSAANGAIFDFKKPLSQRPDGWTSGDAAGLAIFPGLVRYDEVMGQRKIEHALRFTVNKTRHAFVAPARHAAGTSQDKDAPPMGMRVRLKASVNISRYSIPAQVILHCLQTYGMVLADNGSDWYVSGAPDPHWDGGLLGALATIKGRDFEVIDMGK